MKCDGIVRGILLSIVTVMIIVLVSCTSTDFKRIHTDITEVGSPETTEETATSVEAGVITEENAEDTIPEEDNLSPLYVDGTLLPKDSPATEAASAASESTAETKTQTTFVKAEESTEEKKEASADTEATHFFTFFSFTTLDLILLSVCGGFLVVIIILVIVIVRKNRKIRRERMRRRVLRERKHEGASSHVTAAETPQTSHDTADSVDIPKKETVAENSPSDTPEDTVVEAQDNSVKTEKTDEQEECGAEEHPVNETTADEAPVEEPPVEETPVEETPVEETPVEETPVEETPENGSIVDKASAEEVKEPATVNESVSSEPLPEGTRGEAVAVLDSLLREEKKEETADDSRSKPTLEEILRMLKE